MKTKSSPTSFPLSTLGILGAVLSVFFLVYGAVLVWSSLAWMSASAAAFLYSMLYFILGLLFCIGGAVGLLKSVMKIQFTPAGIALTLLGRTFRRYPTENLGTFALVQRGLAKSQTTHLCICTKTVEELAARQDAKRRADDRTRRLAALRRRTTWQEAFAGDYLRKKAGTTLLTLPGRDLCWLNFCLENVGLLRLAYPDVPWLIAPEAQSSPMRYSDDSDPTTAVFPDTKNTLVFDETGAALVKKGRRKDLLAGAQIRTMVCMEQLCGGGGYYEKYLLLISLSPEELIRKHETQVSRRRGTDTLDTLRQFGGWQLLALYHACAGRMPLFSDGCKGKDLVAVRWFSAREEALRRLYPQADFFDCTNEALFRAIFATGGDGHG